VKHCSVLSFVLWLNWAAVIWAAPPKIDAFVPGGLPRGGSVTVTANGAFDPWPVQIWVDRSDIEVTPAEEPGKFLVTAAADALPGICRIRAYNDEGASALRPLVIGILPEVAEVEPNNSPLAAQVIEGESIVVNGRFDGAGDVDVFAREVRQGQTLVASIDAHRSLASPCDAVLQVLSPAGFVLLHNDDDHGLDPQIAFTAPADGRYLVRAFAFPAMPDSTINFSGGANHVYRLTLATGPMIDHAWPGAVTAGQESSTRLSGWNIPEEKALLSVPATTGDPWLTVVPPGFVNPVRLAVKPHAVIGEVEPNAADQPQDVSAPVTIGGHIDPQGDVDAFRFTSAAGQSWLFRVDARGIGSPLDPVLRILDAAGTELARVDDVEASADAELAFNAPAEGEFRVMVSDLYGRGGWRYFYQLTAAAPQADFALSLAAESFTIGPGTPLEIPVTIARRHGFAEEIEVIIEGLPEAVSVAPARSLPQGETSAAIKLTLTAQSGPHSLPMRIVGRGLGASGRTHAAEAAVAGEGARSADIWLSITK
jgi:hypothetical protein